MSDSNPTYSTDFLLGLYRTLLKIRLTEEIVAQIYPEQEMRCPVHLCTGQEAVPAGVCAALRPSDYALGAHRSHGHYLAKGGDLKAMIAEFYGRRTGTSGGRGGSMHLIDRNAGFLGAVPIVASSIPIATGVALAAKRRGENRVTAVFFGDGATEEGMFHESLNFASLQRLPVLYVCENNLYSVYSPLNVRQPTGRTIHALARAHGLTSIHADGNDVLGVYETAREAVSETRTSGPVFLEFATYRWREHCGPHFDNHLGYRTESEFLEYKARCPIARFEAYLGQAGVATKNRLEEEAETIADEVREAVAFAKRSPLPDPSTLMDGVYAP